MIQLIINGKISGQFSSISDCWRPISDFYCDLPDLLPDQYEHIDDWVLLDLETGLVIISHFLDWYMWEAIAEDKNAFRMYYGDLVGWKTKEEAERDHQDWAS